MSEMEIFRQFAATSSHPLRLIHLLPSNGTTTRKNTPAMTARR